MTKKMSAADLPNPFMNAEGNEISVPGDWPEQRKYLRSILTEYLYGEMPPKPENTRAEILSETEILNGAGIEERIRLYCGPEYQVAFNVIVLKPAKKGIYIPVIIPFYIQDAVVADTLKDGYCIAVFDTNEAAPDGPDYGEGSCAKAYPHFSWKVIAMWGWLQSRVIDWLETQSFADTSKVVAAGHSRYGKTALCCAVYDERVAVCVPVGSGCGGTGNLRYCGCRLGEGHGFYETIGQITKGAAFWFSDKLAGYGSPVHCQLKDENLLPFDAHFALAVIAPRPILILEGLDDMWSNPFGTQITWLAGSEVYKFLGADDRCAIHYREGGHEFNSLDWSILRDFCNVMLRGKNKTTLYKTAGQDDIKYGYSWRCPGTKNVTIEDFFRHARGSTKPQKPRWSF